MKSIHYRFDMVLLFIIFFVSFHSTAAAGSSIKLIKIESRPGVTLKFILVKPENPVASVILFAGNNGRLELSSFFGSISIGWLQKDFLVRNREKIAKHGFMVAVMDAPSDKQSGGKSVSGGLNVFSKNNEMFRMSNGHSQDIKAVVSYLKNEANIPLWLVGTSMGTISATNGAIRVKQGIDGLVLTASKTRSGPEWGPIYKSHPNVLANMDLKEISVPVLILHHKEDSCDSSAPEELSRIKQGLINAPKAETKYVSGGESKTEGCHPLSTHGFYGIDDEVVGAIADFIKSNMK